MSQPNTNQIEQAQFKKKISQVMYKTTYQGIGKQKSSISVENTNGINGKFTDHLIYSGMYKNASLTTTPDKDRWLNGSKDWMEHLG